jgi:hypothetical protein
MICATIAHIVLTIVEATSSDPGQFVFTFALLWVFGDIVKLIFLKVEDEYQAIYLPRRRLVLLTALSLVFYIGICIVQILIWALDYVIT